jgi:hypothetical protein
MRAKLLKGLSLLLGSLTACGDSSPGDTDTFACPEYGCSSSCTIVGRVVDANSGAPIEGIQVDTAYHGSPTHTSADGSFSMHINCCDGEIPVRFVDVDGEAGGGCYAPQHSEVATHYAGDDGPCNTLSEQDEPVLAELEGEPAPCTVPEDTAAWW